FPENRVADHRTGFKAHNLDQVLDGALAPAIASAVEAEEAERLARASQR
ncbi:MAG: peptide chain release factor 1, partial [Acidipropionibacterium jensenii]|nr:peptide chain release factor 1 [Acidipropionibacterium jensenii]